jgi:hypothetical protein
MPSEVFVHGGFHGVGPDGEIGHCYVHDGDGGCGEYFVRQPGEGASVFMSRVRASTDRRWLVWGGEAAQ